MENENENEIEFRIPESFMEKLYEFSGDTDKFKGLIVAVCSEGGEPMIYSRFDTAITELGLKKAIIDFANDRIKEQ